MDRIRGSESGWIPGFCCPAPWLCLPPCPRLSHPRRLGAAGCMAPTRPFCLHLAVTWARMVPTGRHTWEAPGREALSDPWPLPFDPPNRACRCFQNNLFIS